MRARQLAGRELARSPATSSQDVSSPARQLAGRELARSQAASLQIADSWRRIITDLGGKV
ncbi:UNVERIFIED_CONTAM: hypothetical protein Slati_3440600 [Sesamum latifolium]|uniref:Uncharacterized protein n=1 Tax=Sesamum latifolium TaxID=2727402 RepID=A0AAW2UIB0_9LAMI